MKDFTYINMYMSDFYTIETCTQPPMQLFEKCAREKPWLFDEGGINNQINSISPRDMFTRPLVVRGRLGKIPEYSTATERVIDYEKFPVTGHGMDSYIHVYGMVQTVIVDIINQSDARNFVRHAGIESFLQTLIPRRVLDTTNGARPTYHNIPLKISGAKLIYKLPANHAAAGMRYMLKLYLGGKNPVATSTLRGALKGIEGGVYGATLGDSALSLDSKWVMSNQGTMKGEMKLPDNVQFTRSLNGLYQTADVMYKDVKFVNGIEFNLNVYDTRRDILRVLHVRVVEIINNLSDNGGVDALNINIKHLLLHKLTNLELELTRNGDEGEFASPTGVRWTLKNLTKYYVYGVLGDLVDFYTRDHINRAVVTGNELRGGLPGNVCRIGLDEIQQSLNVCKLQYMLRTMCKTFWKYDFSPRYITGVIENVALGILNKVTRAQRRICWDIETNYVPHSKEEETITCIHMLVYDCGAHSTPYEHRTFIHIPQNRQNDAAPGTPIERVYEFNYAKIIKICSEQVQCKIDVNMIKDQTFFIHPHTTEKAMLKDFLARVRTYGIESMSYFNGNKFDLPRLVNRMQILKIDGLSIPKKYKGDVNIKPSFFNLSFSNRKDRASIKYMRDNKVVNYKMVAMREFAAEKEMLDDIQNQVNDRPRGGGWGYDDDDGLVGRSSSFGSAPGTVGDDGNLLTASRKIFQVLFNDIGTLDVMLEVGDKIRGCKLDTAAENLLGIRKLSNEAVHYENLTKTLKYGDLDVYVAYCILDVIITMMLDQYKQTTSYYMGMSTLSYMSTRELFKQSTLPTTLATFNAFGWWRNIVSMDPSVFRDETYQWKPDFKYNHEKDFENLQPKAGRTVTGTSGNYGGFMTYVLDYTGQYPAIMRAHNICTSSLLTQEQIFGLKEGVHYNKVVIENTRPKLIHLCPEGGCRYREKDRFMNPKCKTRMEYELVYYTAYYSTPSYFKALSAESSEELTDMRNKYKNLKQQAEGIGDIAKKELYDKLQLAVKVSSNAQYGVLLRMSAIVGGTITQYGRNQNEIIAEKGILCGMEVINADTDSVMLLDNNLALDKQIGDDINDVGALSRLRSRLFPTGETKGRPVLVSDMVKAIYAKNEQFVSDLNNGIPGVSKPAYEAPCRLEVDKIFTIQVVDEKKCYNGFKLVPDTKEYKFHVAGMSGKKADKTLIKSATQFIGCKLLGRRDNDGLLRFIRDVYDCVSVELRANEIAQFSIDSICSEFDTALEEMLIAKSKHPKERSVEESNIVEKMMANMDPLEVRTASIKNEVVRERIKRFNACGAFEEIVRMHGGVGLLGKDEYLSSLERVGDIRKPVTAATKRALNNCIRNGVPANHAPMLVVNCPRTEVQVSAAVIKRMEVILRADEPEEWIYRRGDRDRKLMGSKKFTTEQNRLKKKMEKAEEDRKTIKPLTVTGMPEKYLAPSSRRVGLSERNCGRMHNLLKYVKGCDKSLRTERNGKFTEAKIAGYTLPKLFNNKEVLEETLARIRALVNGYKMDDPVLPLWWYDEKFCVTRYEELEQCKGGHYRTKHFETPVRLWDLWSGIKRWFHIWTEDSLIYLEEVEDSSHETYIAPGDYSMIHTNVRIMEDIEVYVDMEAYSKQTRSVPIILTDPHGKKRFIMNHDSYCVPENNRFAFSIPYNMFGQLTEYPGKFIKFTPEKGTVIIEDSNECGCKVTISVERFLRDDGIHVPIWRYNNDRKPRIIKKRDLKKLINLPTNGETGGANIEFRFVEDEGGDGVLKIRPENSPNEEDDYVRFVKESPIIDMIEDPRYAIMETERVRYEKTMLAQHIKMVEEKKKKTQKRLETMREKKMLKEQHMPAAARITNFLQTAPRKNNVTRTNINDTINMVQPIKKRKINKAVKSRMLVDFFQPINKNVVEDISYVDEEPMEKKFKKKFDPFLRS